MKLAPLADSSARDSTLYEVEVFSELTPEWLARKWESKYPRVLQVLELQEALPLPAARSPATRVPSDPCYR